MQRILIFTDWFVPAYKAGGPIKSIFNLITLLKNDYHFYIVCGDRDLHDTEPFDGVELNIWQVQQGYEIIYLSKNRQTVGQYKKLILEKKPHWLYFNSLFSLHFTILPLLAFRLLSLSSTNVLLAPRGMLGAGALALKRPKKLAFLTLVRLSGLLKGILWHATSTQEKEEIQRHFPGAVCRTAENLIGLVNNKSISHEKQKQKGKAEMFFLSRISPKKNLLFALRTLLNLEDSCQLNFSIIGPVEDQEYWNQCQLIIDQLNSKKNISVHLIGPVPNNQLNEILGDKHFLLLPTLNENYGHVIVESWLHGCPVIISDQTPWQNLLEQKLGWSLPLHADMFIDAIQAACLMNQTEFELWSNNSIVFSEALAKSANLLDRSKMLFSC